MDSVRLKGGAILNCGDLFQNTSGDIFRARYVGSEHIIAHKMVKDVYPVSFDPVEHLFYTQQSEIFTLWEFTCCINKYALSRAMRDLDIDDIDNKINLVWNNLLTERYGKPGHGANN